MNKLQQAFALFDAYNQQDPQLITWDGVAYPATYFYALQLHHWVNQLAPNPSEPLLLASRSQHIGRWTVPRSTYPAGKAGYYQWRTDLAAFHATKAGELLQQAGYDEAIINRVQCIIRKENLRTDHEVQIMESALCLVFLQYQYVDFIKDYEDEKVIRILKKTWNKMESTGKQAAATLQFTGRAKELLNRAIG